MKYQFTIIAKEKDREKVNEISKELKMLANNFDVNIKTVICISDVMGKDEISITPKAKMKESESIEQNYIEFHSSYLEKYVSNEKIDLALMDIDND